MTQTLLLKSILVLILIFVAINHVIWLKNKSRAPFNYLLHIQNLYAGFHTLYVLIVEHFFLAQPLYDRLAPFSLMYGPFIYFSFFIIHDKRIPLKWILLNSGPFLLFSIGYIVTLISGFSPRLVYLQSLGLGLATVLSFIGYSVWAIVYNAKPIKNHFKQHKVIIITSTLILLFAGIIMFAAVISIDKLLTADNSIGLLRFIIYCCMLSGVLLILRFQKIATRQSREWSDLPEELKTEIAVIQPVLKYEKSMLSEEQLEVYFCRLEELMNKQQVYLQTDLSLVKLAQLMRVPNHHVTQLLNLKIKLNFYDYVNGFRVRHACRILAENKTDTLEHIAAQSGFNSKPSFNRQFKSIKGLTPSEYRVKSRF